MVLLLIIEIQSIWILSLSSWVMEFCKMVLTFKYEEEIQWCDLPSGYTHIIWFHLSRPKANSRAQ